VLRADQRSISDGPDARRRIRKSKKRQYEKEWKRRRIISKVETRHMNHSRGEKPPEQQHGNLATSSENILGCLALLNTHIDTRQTKKTNQSVLKGTNQAIYKAPCVCVVCIDKDFLA
jgi:hypothetical protein